jgi:putative inorganic carbon (hco3(-)) transporter
MSVIQHSKKDLSRYSYVFYLLLLIWAPLPHASNTPLYLTLLTTLILLVGTVVFVESTFRKINVLSLLQPYWLPITLLFVVSCWVLFQSTAFSPQLIESFSTSAATYYSAIASAEHPLAFISLSPGDTGMKALFSFSLCVFFALTILLHQRADRIKTTLMVIVLCGTAQALYGSFMVLSGQEYGFFMEKEYYRGVATGTFINRNHLAGYLEMSLACGIGLLVSSLGQKGSSNWRARARAGLDVLLGPKMRLRIYLAFMVIALVLTRSRMGNSAFFIALPISGFLYMVMERKINWGAIILFSSLMLVDFLIVGQWFGFDELAQRLESTSVQTENRDEVVRDSMILLEDNVVVGTGLGTYYTAYPPYQQDDVRAYYDHAHNDYLQFAIELGLAGFLPLALLVLASAGMAITAMFNRQNRLAKGVAFAASMGILSLLIHSIVDFNLQMPANALLFVLVLSLGWMARQQQWLSS